jgi:hypothetical protein
MKPITKTIDDPNAPARLRGKAVTILLDPASRTLAFEVDMPDDPTPNEIGYVEWSVGEYLDALRPQFPFIGEKRSGVLTHTEDAANG